MRMWFGNLKFDTLIYGGQTRAIFLLATTVLFLCASAQNVNVTAEDPRIDYVGDWVLQDGGGHKFVNTPGSYLTLTFQGSAIFWYGAKAPNSGVASVLVDAENPQIIDASAGTGANDNSIVEVLFNQTGLDPNKAHTLNISYVGPGALGGPYVTIYLLAFTPPGNSVPTISIPLPSTSAGSVTMTGVQSSLSALSSASSSADPLTPALHAAQHTNVILGAVLGTIVGLLLISAILLLLLVFRNRRNQRALYGEASPFFSSSVSTHARSGFSSKTSGTPGTLTTEISSPGFTSMGASPRPIERSPISPISQSVTSGSLQRQTAESSPPVYTA